MSWDQFVANIKDFFLQPVVIAVCTAIIVLIVILIILSQTSFGRKLLKRMKEKVDGLTNDFKTHKEATEKKVQELQEGYEKKLQVAEAKVSVLEEIVLVIAEHSHNEKIKEIVEKSKEKLSICKTDFESLVEDKILSEKERVITEFKEKYEDFYKSYLSEAKSKVDELVEQAEKVAETVQKQAISMKEEAEKTAKELKEVIEDEKVSGFDSNAEEEKTLQD